MDGFEAAGKALLKHKLKEQGGASVKLKDGRRKSVTIDFSPVQEDNVLQLLKELQQDCKLKGLAIDDLRDQLQEHEMLKVALEEKSDELELTRLAIAELRQEFAAKTKSVQELMDQVTKQGEEMKELRSMVEDKEDEMELARRAVEELRLEMRAASSANK